MTPEQLAAIKAVLNALSQFVYGPIGDDAPYQGLVSLTPAQYQALRELVKP